MGKGEAVLSTNRFHSPQVSITRTGIVLSTNEVFPLQILPSMARFSSSL